MSRRIPDNLHRSHIRLIGLDGDDTLWQNEPAFVEAGERFRSMLARYGCTDGCDLALLETERANLQVYGYGVKAFTLSMIETAVRLSRGRLDCGDVDHIIEIGKQLLAAPVRLLPGVDEGVRRLASAGLPLILITKGDLHHQESKLGASGLRDQFRRVHVVAEKEPKTYTRILDDHAVAPGEFVMVGNSLRSDVHPVLAIGAWAIQVPQVPTWQHEHAPEPSPAARFSRLESFDQVAALLAQTCAERGAGAS